MAAAGNGNPYRALWSDIAIFTVGTVLAKAIQFLLMPLYTSCMSTAAYGVAELTNNLSELLFPVATLCIYEAAFRYAVDPDFPNERLATAVAKVMLASTGLGLAVAVCVKRVFHYRYAFHLFLIVYAHALRMCAAYYVRGRGQSRAFAMSGMVYAAALSAWNVLFLVILRAGANGYLLSVCLSSCLSAIYLMAAGRIPAEIRLRTSGREEIGILLRYCIPLVFYNVLYGLTTLSGRYILLWLTDAATAGKYMAAMKIAAVVHMLQQAVYAAFQLNASRAYAHEGREAFYSECINLLTGLYCALGAVVVCLTPLLARLALKNDFYEAGVYLPIILLAAILHCVSSLLGTLYSAYRKTRRMVGASLVGAITNLAAGLALTPLCGIWGVCMASVLCYLGQIVYKLVDVRGFCKIRYHWRKLLPNLGILAVQVAWMSSGRAHAIVPAAALALALCVMNGGDAVRAMKRIARG